jgi:hypothetical protein
MGNNNSSNSSNTQTTQEQSFSKIMETIAEKYILTQNFDDMVKLNDPRYCDKIVVLTSELLNENLNTHEIEYMVQKTKAGLDVYEKTKQTLTFLSKEQFNTINNQIPPLQKKRMCVGIARFFVRIAQIYSAIFMLLNPTYIYTDSYGNKRNISFEEKKSLPPNVTIEKIYLNLCNERLDYLTKHSSIPENEASTDTMFVKPDFCSYGINTDGTTQNLYEQIGLKELEKLYYDVYDYDVGKFNKISPTMREQYNNDLFMLYAAFTDSDAKELPAHIKSFSDIKLKIYKNKPTCMTPKNPFNIKHHGTLNDALFREYAIHIKNMKQNIQNRQQQLLDIIKELFISVIDQSTGKTTFSIHPELNADQLQEINKKVIRLLVEQYVSCEKDYKKGLELYESIVENKLQKLTESQIKTLEEQMKGMVDKISN